MFLYKKKEDYCLQLYAPDELILCETVVSPNHTKDCKN